MVILVLVVLCKTLTDRILGIQVILIIIFGYIFWNPIITLRNHQLLLTLRHTHLAHSLITHHDPTLRSSWLPRYLSILSLFILRPRRAQFCLAVGGLLPILLVTSGFVGVVVFGRALGCHGLVVGVTDMAEHHLGRPVPSELGWVDGAWGSFDHILGHVHVVLVVQLGGHCQGRIVFGVFNLLLLLVINKQLLQHLSTLSWSRRRRRQKWQLIFLGDRLTTFWDYRLGSGKEAFLAIINCLAEPWPPVELNTRRPVQRSEAWTRRNRS